MLGAKSTKPKSLPTHKAAALRAGSVCESVDPTKRAILNNAMFLTMSKLDKSLIEKIQLGTYSDSDVENIAVLKITSMLSRSGDNLRASKVTEYSPGTDVNSCYLGTFNRDIICLTCHQDIVTCPGHYGYIDLIDYYINPLYLDIIRLVLSCVCHSCGTSLLSEDLIKSYGLDKLKGIEKLKAIAAKCGGIPCKKNKATHEPNDRPKIDFESINEKSEVGDDESVELERQATLPQIRACGMNQCVKVEGRSFFLAGKTKTPFSVNRIRLILNAISDEDAILLGFDVTLTHPRNMIFKNLLVVPPIVRPPASFGGITTEHRLTIVYDDIVRLLKQYAGAKDSEKFETYNAISDNIMKLLIKPPTVEYSKNGKELAEPTTISKMVSKKEGIFRKNIMGKRSTQGGRSVISPDCDNAVGEVGIPKVWSKTLNIPEAVTHFNYNEMIKLIRNGEIVNIMINGTKSESEPYVVTPEMYKELIPVVGDVLYRRIRNDDWVIINRQPTLSKQSMMAARIKLEDTQSIRLPLPYTGAFNADFDGDEMNIHLPSSAASRLEAEFLMNVERCAIDTESGSPAIGCVYDGITGAYLLTLPSTKISRKAYEYCLLSLNDSVKDYDFEVRLRKHGIQGVYDENDMVSGRILFSRLLPHRFFYTRGKVIIKDGILLPGTEPVTKADVGRSRGSIIHQLYLTYDVETMSRFITECTRMTNRFLTIYGFTIGINDCKIDNLEILNYVKNNIAELKIFVSRLGDLDSYDKYDQERNEDEIITKMSNVTSEIGNKVMTLLPSNHPLKAMVASGAKGKADANIVPIMVIVGKQLIRGHRMLRQTNNGRRFSPHFPMGCNSVESRGFIDRSFYAGLNQIQVVMIMVGSREGLADTAISTASTGYMYRQIVKTVENATITANGVVRTFRNQIVGDIYGSDGFDPRKVQDVSIGGKFYRYFIDPVTVCGQFNSLYGY